MRWEWGEQGRGARGDWGEAGMGRSRDGEDRGWGEAGMGRSGDGEKRGWGEPRLHREWGEPGPGMERDAALSYPRMLSREAPVLPCPAAPQLPALPPFRCRSRSVRGSSQLSRSPTPAGGRGGAGGTGGGGTGTRPETGREPRLGMRDPGDPGGVEGGAALEPCGVTGKYLGSCFLGGGGRHSVPPRGCDGRGIPAPLWGFGGGASVDLWGCVGVPQHPYRARWGGGPQHPIGLWGGGVYSGPPQGYGFVSQDPYGAVAEWAPVGLQRG